MGLEKIARKEGRDIMSCGTNEKRVPSKGQALRHKHVSLDQKTSTDTQQKVKSEKRWDDQREP